MSSFKETDSNGDIYWYKVGTNTLHREDGPAIEYANGKAWYKEGKRHREVGPAVEWANGNKSWYYHGEKIDCKDQETFERILKLKAFW